MASIDDCFVGVARQKGLVVYNGSCVFHNRLLHFRHLIAIEAAVVVAAAVGVVVVVVAFFHSFGRSCGSSRTLAGIGLMTKNNEHLPCVAAPWSSTTQER